MIGFIFHQRRLSRIEIQRETKENIEFYIQLAKEYEIDLMFYSPDGLLGDEKAVNGYLFSHLDEQWSRQKLPLPRVNMIRTMIQDPKVHHRMGVLESHNFLFINKTQGRNKDKINQYLKEIEETGSYIPDTTNLSFKNVLIYLNRYRKIIIKPVNGSLGERILKLEKRGSFHDLHYIRNRKQHRRVFLSTRKLYLFFKRLFRKPSFYLIQQWIDLKGYEDTPFDIRTSVQKNIEGQWSLTGIVARVAKKDGIVTNVAQGGRAVRFEEVKTVLSNEMEMKIINLSLLLAKKMEVYNPHAADLGFDIGVDENENLWFIEANYCDERYAYRESGDYEMWYQSYKVPFSYAIYKYRENYSVTI